jgi:hypothetical protein
LGNLKFLSGNHKDEVLEKIYDVHKKDEVLEKFKDTHRGYFSLIEGRDTWPSVVRKRWDDSPILITKNQLMLIDKFDGE